MELFIRVNGYFISIPYYIFFTSLAYMYMYMYITYMYVHVLYMRPSLLYASLSLLDNRVSENPSSESSRQAPAPPPPPFQRATLPVSFTIPVFISQAFERPARM